MATRRSSSPERPAAGRAPSKASDADARFDRTPCKLYVKTSFTVTTSLGVASTPSPYDSRHRPDDRLDVAPPSFVLLVRDREVGPPPQIKSYESDGARRREGLLPAHDDLWIK